MHGGANVETCCRAKTRHCAARDCRAERNTAEVCLKMLCRFTQSWNRVDPAAPEHATGASLPIWSMLCRTAPRTCCRFVQVRIRRVNGASHGCLFLAANAAASEDRCLRDLPARHKVEVAHRAARKTGICRGDAKRMWVQGRAGASSWDCRCGCKASARRGDAGSLNAFEARGARKRVCADCFP